MGYRIPKHNRDVLDDFREVAIWGFTGRSRTYSTWNRVQRNDLVSFYQDKNFISLCKVIGKCQSEKLAKYLWNEDETGDTWQYIYFIDRPRPITKAHILINRIVGNRDDYYYRQAEIYRHAGLIEELCEGMNRCDFNKLLEPDQFNLKRRKKND